MKKIILISCSSKKTIKTNKAKDLYCSTLFKYSLRYAESLKPDHIFILSAKHHLLKLDDLITPYDVTLSSVSKSEREKKPNLKVLDKKEKDAWGIRILEQLSEYTDFINDEILILAGNEYYKPLSKKIKPESMILKGRIGERNKFLINQIGKNS